MLIHRSLWSMRCYLAGPANVFSTMTDHLFIMRVRIWSNEVIAICFLSNSERLLEMLIYLSL